MEIARNKALWGGGSIDARNPATSMIKSATMLSRRDDVETFETSE